MIRWTTPVSRKRITYRTERVGATKLRREIVQNILLNILHSKDESCIFSEYLYFVSLNDWHDKNLVLEKKLKNLALRLIKIKGYIYIYIFGQKEEALCSHNNFSVLVQAKFKGMYECVQRYKLCSGRRLMDWHNMPPSCAPD